MVVKEEVPRRLLIRLPARCAGPPDGDLDTEFFKKNSKSRIMASFEKKSDQFTRRKIQGFGSENFAECFKMLQIVSKCVKQSEIASKLLVSASFG